MKTAIAIGIICALIYFGLSVSVRKNTACAGVSDTHACLTLNIR